MVDDISERKTITLDIASLETVLTNAVSEGVISGFDKMISDPERVQKFWKRGFDELWSHGSEETKQAVGGAIMKWLAGILLVAALTLALKFGGK